MSNKYKLTKETKVVDGHTLHRIQALKSFGNVKAGDLGGWIEEWNLSQTGNCWIYDDSMVYDRGAVMYNGIVTNNSKVHGNRTRIFHKLDNQEVEGFCVNNYNINYTGFDEKTGSHFVRVGCQDHSITNWKDQVFRENIMSRNGFPRYEETRFLKILFDLESKYCSKKDPFVRIEANISEMKKTVTEALKTETISLISSLPVSVPVVVKSGPQRDKFGRFAKKGK